MFCGSTTLRANVSLPDVVSNGIGSPARPESSDWGKAVPGEAITITFAGQKKRTVADKDGKWLVD
jgi:sialate O-acetylesterase